jgi:hypothetical protein
MKGLRGVAHRKVTITPDNGFGRKSYCVTVDGIGSCGHPYHFWVGGCFCSQELTDELAQFPDGREVTVGLCESCERRRGKR